MSKIAYLVDSTSGCKEEPQNHIYMVPLNIVEIKNGVEKNYKAGIDIDLISLGEKLKTGSKFKTGQTVFGEVEEKVNELLKKYDHVIGFPIDRQLSGTYQSWKIIEKDLGSDKFHVLDILDVEKSVYWWVQDIQQYLVENKYDTKAMDTFVTKLAKKRGGAIIVSDVSQLISGGRLKGLKAFFVKTLKLKILIKLLPATGHLEYFNKARHEDEAMKLCIQFLDEHIKWSQNGIKRAALISTVLDQKRNEEIAKAYEKLLPPGTKVDIYEFSTVVAVHTGMDTHSIYLEAN